MMAAPHDQERQVRRHSRRLETDSQNL
jgi:hypothetical protein